MLVVNEIFYSIQGESTQAGRPCLFVRLTGCNLRCTWCDTVYAFYEGRAASVTDLLQQIDDVGCRFVEITGGEPLLQKEVYSLMQELLRRGYEVAVETGGGVSIEQVPEGVKRIVDIKCPGSGMVERNHWDNLELLREGDELKFVLLDREDYLWAKQEIESRGLAGRCPLLFSPVHGHLEPGRLARWMLKDRSPAQLQIQLHRQLWPDKDRGI
jgi:7-carboxy-7-deazaguanine synthase